MNRSRPLDRRHCHFHFRSSTPQIHHLPCSTGQKFDKNYPLEPYSPCTLPFLSIAACASCSNDHAESCLRIGLGIPASRQSGRLDRIGAGDCRFGVSGCSVCHFGAVSFQYHTAYVGLRQIDLAEACQSSSVSSQREKQPGQRAC